MGNSLGGCLACILPCGALDVIRIIHVNGYIEEIPGPITAGEILKNNPNHVLSKPSSESVVRRFLILSPESELKRGTIYFLIPDPSMPSGNSKKSQDEIHKKPSSKRRKNKCGADTNVSACSTADRYVTETESENKSAHRDRRRRRVCVWRPHLESISEDL